MKVSPMEAGINHADLVMPRALGWIFLFDDRPCLCCNRRLSREISPASVS
jgi:hypothetical protein